MTSKLATSNNFIVHSNGQTVAILYSLVERATPDILLKCALKVFTNSTPVDVFFQNFKKPSYDTVKINSNLCDTRTWHTVSLCMYDFSYIGALGINPRLVFITPGSI